MTARTRGPELRATTILAVRHRGRVVMAGDGQVTIGQTIMKRNARKLRRLYQDRVLAGFAGAGADALTLFERFEAKLQQVSGNLRRAAVDLAKDWRTDRLLRRLEALLVIADRESSLVVSGTGAASAPPSARWRSRSAIAGGASTCRPSCATRSRPRTSS